MPGNVEYHLLKNFVGFIFKYSHANRFTFLNEIAAKVGCIPRRIFSVFEKRRRNILNNNNINNVVTNICK